MSDDKQPRPASPTPEQPAQELSDEEMRAWGSYWKLLARMPPAGLADAAHRLFLEVDRRRRASVSHGALVGHMVSRFLGWRLPEDFRPDAGISFKATFNEHTAYPGRHEPSGTNLLDATQAEAMVRYMIDGMPALAPPEQPAQDGDAWGMVTNLLDAIGGSGTCTICREVGDPEDGGVTHNPEKVCGIAQCAALAPPAQTQQGLSEEGIVAKLAAEAHEKILRQLVDFAYQQGWHEHGYDVVEAFADETRAAALNPDKQPSPSAAPAQEIRHHRNCAFKGPGAHPEHCMDLAGTVLLRHRAASPEGALREAQELRVFVKIKATELLTNERCVCGHTDNQHSGELCFGTEGDRGEDGDGSCPCSKSGSFRMDIADTLLECMGMLTDDESAVLFMREVLRLAALAGQPAREDDLPPICMESVSFDVKGDPVDGSFSGTKPCAEPLVCPRHSAREDALVRDADGEVDMIASLRKGLEKRSAEDDRKALRAAALERLAALVSRVPEMKRCYDRDGEWVALYVSDWNAIRALAGSPAGEGREDNQEQQSGKGE